MTTAISRGTGGLTECTGPFDFEAPVDGYQASVTIDMPVGAKKWSSDVNKNYFAKLPAGRYARFSRNLYPGDRHFVVIESDVNPDAIIAIWNLTLRRRLSRS